VGEVSQHSEYFAFGETFIEEHKDSHNSPYKFNGKELDEETGFYYYGARYYDPRVSFWMSVDPLAEKFPEWSPYTYCLNNPLKFTDPDGRAPIDPLQVMKIRDNRASNLQGRVRNGGTRPHQGFDLAAKNGTPVMAVKDATVFRIVKDEKAAYGNQILLKITDKEGNVSYAQYSHLSKVDVKLNQEVKEGTVIGATGMSGNASNLPESQAHLHFEMRDSPNVGLGLKGRLDPNSVLDTKFYTQNSSGNQTATGVIKVDKDGTKTKMNIDGTTQKMETPKKASKNE
jgi:RHS repeat-associated protein